MLVSAGNCEAAPFETIRICLESEASKDWGTKAYIEVRRSGYRLKDNEATLRRAELF
jgi:hypothetical protein